MARRYSVNAGHSAGSPGASGNGLREHVEARWATSRMVMQLGAMGNWAGNSTSDAATQRAVLEQQVARARAHNPHIVISNHFNAFSNATARGVEVLYRGAAMLPLARAVSAAIARELGIPNRGAKQRTDLFFLNSFSNNGILIEWCFLTNAADVAAWNARRVRAVDAAARTIAANTGGQTASAALPASPVLPASNPHQIANITAARFRVTAATLNVRSEPTTNSRIMGTLRQDTVLTASRRASNGSSVNGNRRWLWTGSGWVSEHWVAGNVQQFRTTARANFRVGAGTNQRIIRTLNANVVVTAVSTTVRQANGFTWRNVAVGGQRGWMAMSNLRLI